jgi:hypothetical protein
MTDTTGRTATVTAFFDSRDEARRAIDRLTAIGLPDGCLHLTEGRPDDTEASPDTHHDTRGFFEALSDFFFPDDSRATYAEGLSRGGYLVTARDIPDGLHDTVVDVLDDEGAVDIDERAAGWRSEGWTGFTAAQTGAPADILAGTGLGATGRDAGRDVGGEVGGEVGAGTSGMAGMDKPHAGVTADRAGESRGMITQADRRGDLWQRDMARGRPRVRSYTAVPQVDEDAPDAVERNNLPS